MRARAVALMSAGTMQSVRVVSLAAAVVCASSALVSTPALAQFAQGTVEVALQGGGSIDTHHTDHSVGLVSRSLAYSLTDGSQIGLRFGEAIDRGGDVSSLFSARADALLPPAGKIVPYLGLQCGALLRYDDGVVATGSYGLQIGGKIPVTRKFGVSLEVGYSLPMTGAQTGSVSVIAGLFWLFPPAPKPPPD